MPSHPTQRKRHRLDKMVYAQPGAIGLMTACTENRRSLFSTPHNADNIVEELRRLHGKSWRVLGFCVMLDHVHILVFNVEGSLLDFMRLLKGRIAHGLREDVAGAVWQRSFHDHLIRRNEDIAATLRYLLENPVRAGLARKWTKYPWSGSLQWPEIGPEFFAVNPSDVLWAEIFAL